MYLQLLQSLARVQIYQFTEQSIYLPICLNFKNFNILTVLIKEKYFFSLCLQMRQADVAELVDALDLGSSAARRGGSSPSIRTSKLRHL